MKVRMSRHLGSQKLAKEREEPNKRSTSKSSEENSSMRASTAIPSLSCSHLDLGFRCILSFLEFESKTVEKEKDEADAGSTEQSHASP
jgi:hypothetical protein